MQKMNSNYISLDKLDTSTLQFITSDPHYLSSRGINDI